MAMKTIRTKKNNTEQRILEAAVQLFARQGFSGTSTREIARLADVNETSVFRHFPHKQDLFWAALQSRLQHVRPRRELEEGLSQVANPERVIPLIVEFLVHTGVFNPDVVRLLLVGALELRPGTEQLYNEYLTPIGGALRTYVEECGKKGTLRKLDPSLTLLAFTSTILAQLSLYPLLMGSCGPFSNADEAVAAHSRFWLSALKPKGEELNVQALSPIGVKAAAVAGTP
jgi:AcrR family transcriptional regulator